MGKCDYLCPSKTLDVECQLSGEPGCWRCEQLHECMRCTFCFRQFPRCVNFHLAPACCMWKTYCMLGLSPSSLVLYNFKPVELYLPLLYASVIFPSILCILLRLR